MSVRPSPPMDNMMFVWRWEGRLSESVASPAMGNWGTCPLYFKQCHFSPLWSKSDSQLPKYCAVCEISWCRCQQLTAPALSISTAVVTKLLVIEQLLHPAVKSTVSPTWHNFHLFPSSQQVLATPLIRTVLCRIVCWSCAQSWAHLDEQFLQFCGLGLSH